MTLTPRNRTTAVVFSALLLSGLLAIATPPPPSSAAGSTTTLLALGDMANCAGSANPSATPAADVASLIASRPGQILALGDLAYPNGSNSDFNNCFDPIFGQYKNRILPVVGNHEYRTRNPANQPIGYINYFGLSATGPASKLYYEKTIGDWQLLVLNTNNSCLTVNCRTGSGQYNWLRDKLAAANAANPNQCRIIAMHHPRWTSYDNYSDQRFLGGIMDLAYEYGTDLILTGHAHHYERFAPQTPDQVADPANGFQLMILGTGGTPIRNTGNRAPNSAAVVQAHGLTQFELGSDSYSWSFVDTNGTVRDSGSRDCVNKGTVTTTTTRPTPPPTTGFTPGPGENNETGAAIFRLYRAVFLRNPDRGGFTYWNDLRHDGLSLNYIAEFFTASEEFRLKYGGLSNGQFIDLLYRNALNRSADAGGRAYWLSEMSRGIDRGQIVTFFSDSPEFRDKTPFGN